MKSIHWFRNDLRLADNPALSAASGNDVLPIFILDPKDSENMGQASKLWLHHSLNKLNESLDGKLQFIHGDTIDEIRKLIDSEKIDAIYWNKIFEPEQELKDRDLIKLTSDRFSDIQWVTLMETRINSQRRWNTV